VASGLEKIAEWRLKELKMHEEENIENQQPVAELQ